MVVFGLLLGLSIEIRPIALLVVPMVLIVLWRAGGMRVALERFALVVAVVIAVMIPWTVRNAVVMKAFLPIGTTTGDNLCIGNFPGAQGHFAFPDYCFGHDPDIRRPAFETNRNSLPHQPAAALGRRPPDEGAVARASAPAGSSPAISDGISAAQSYGADPFIPADTANRLSDLGATLYFYRRRHPRPDRGAPLGEGRRSAPALPPALDRGHRHLGVASVIPASMCRST